MTMAPLYARLYGLDCASGDRSGCVGNCSHQAGVYFGDRFDRCPIAEAEDDMRLRTVCMLRHHASLNPLSDFPQIYAAWVTSLWTEVDEQVASIRKQEVDGDG